MKILIAVPTLKASNRNASKAYTNSKDLTVALSTLIMFQAMTVPRQETR